MWNTIVPPIAVYSIDAILLTGILLPLRENFLPTPSPSNPASHCSPVILEILIDHSHKVIWSDLREVTRTLPLGCPIRPSLIRWYMFFFSSLLTSYFTFRCFH